MIYKTPCIYIIGSLRNPRIPVISELVRGWDFDVFDDWYAAGPTADDAWRDYERARGHTYPQALAGLAAKHVFDFDYEHLRRADAAILVTPAGKSAHLELGWMLGRDRPGYILLDDKSAADPEFRYDVMYRFATLVSTELSALLVDFQTRRP